MKNYYDHDVIAKAITYAAENHKGMVRKKTEIPYIVHPMEAAAIVATMTVDANVIAAAVLHDVVEDTPITVEILRTEFNDIICDLVAEESEDKREGQPASETWRIRKEEAIETLKKASTEAKMVALGDKLSNIRAMARDYRKSGEALWDRFNQNDPKVQGWYYESLLEAFGELREFDAYDEYRMKVEEVFGQYK
jgi:GTP diphosphokinase / guanosine-3',5'-bis(diphosphate) 3'-diphosphatase